MTPNHLPPLLALLLPLAACAPDPTTAATTAAAAPAAPAATATGTAALTTREELRASVRQLTSRDAANLKASPGATAGSRELRAVAGFQDVVMARARPDGTVSTRCVGTPEEADAFLDGTSAGAPARADK